VDARDAAAVVSGGASGLGLETGRALIGAGAKVTLLDRDAERVEQAAAEIGALGLACDVAEAQAVESAFARAAEAHGPARIVVNCAGVAPAKRIVGRDGPMPIAEFETVVRVNLIGTFNCLRVGAAAMIPLEPNDEGERGLIVNTASVAAFEGQIGQAAYAASKGGVAALTLPAAREFARHGIRVVAIAPGLFATPMLLSMPQNVQDSLAATVPFPQRFGRAGEYAALVVHILANPMLNGATVRLDGALRMAPQ
jgi:NAD(P)-dependent dehydrogenase (short-subunit alcohol dehydrogenase family)